MKTILKILLSTIGVGILVWAILHDLSITSYKIPDESGEQHAITTPSGYARYSTDGNEMTFELPEEYAYSSIRKNVRPNAKLIFAATSSKILFTVDKMPDPDHSFDSQEQAVDTFYQEFPANGVGKNGSVQKTMTKQIIGSNYFLVIERERPVDDGYNTDYARQYVTYYDNSMYFIDFVTPWKEAYDTEAFDEIVSTIRFN